MTTRLAMTSNKGNSALPANNTLEHPWCIPQLLLTRQRNKRRPARLTKQLRFALLAMTHSSNTRIQGVVHTFKSGPKAFFAWPDARSTLDRQQLETQAV